MKKLTTKYIPYVLLGLLGFILWYLAVSFIKLEPNITKWGEDERFVITLFGAFTSFVFIGVYAAKKENSDTEEIGDLF